MINKRRPNCDVCISNKEVIRKTVYKGKVRYYCKKCHRNFTVDYTIKRKNLWIRYIDGTSLRKLADQLSVNFRTLGRNIDEELNKLIDNNYLSKTHVDKKKYKGILILDGKYVKVKGLDKKIPFIYGVDYHSHDIVISVLCLSESTESFKKVFRILKDINYPLRVVVCDNVLKSLIPALKYHYPSVLVQLCLIHYAENLRTVLNVRKENMHLDFFNEIYDLIYHRYGGNADHNFRKLLFKYEKNIHYQNVLLNIYGDFDFLFNYVWSRDMPNNTNLIELFNSHFNSRIALAKGFNSFKTADRFLNALVLRRRTLPFTDCSAKFSYLNNICSLDYLKSTFSYKEITKSD